MEKVTGEQKRVEFMVLLRFGRASGSCRFIRGASSVKWERGMSDMTGVDVMPLLFTLWKRQLEVDGGLRGRRTYLQ